MSTTNATTSNVAPAWRQFSFFDVVPVKDPHDLDSSPYIFKVATEISTIAPSSAGMLVADIHGSVHLLNRDFETLSSWVAHTGGRVTHMVEQNGILVTLGEEDTVKSPLLKIWDLDNRDKKNGAPILLRSAKVQQSNRPHPVTTLASSSGLTHLAIGLGDGTVILYRHLDQSLSSSSSLTALPKARTIHESPTEPITGLGFKEPTDDTPSTHLFIVTTNRVLTYQVSGRGSGGSPVTVDEIGCGLGCATMDWRARDIVVARDEAIYLCGTEGRGACYAYEGVKSSVHTHLSYLVIVSPPFFPSASAASATVRNYVARSGSNANETDITKVTVFDLENKLVAYSGTFRQGVREVVSQWGKVYVLSTDGKLLSLEEKSTASKLEMLYHKSLYVVALNLAKTQNLDESSVADIHKQFGDHLYAKGDYDNAMQQYIQTIGVVQPSYVIRKFLDSQRIHNLVTYLQELHTLGLANSDHTTLLLNTYTKLKDVARLDSFIKAESRRSDTGHGEEELPFDLDTAIRVCRQAGYFEHASYLARKYERHEDYLRIQVEDAGNVKDALEYLRKLGPEAAESNLARYGRAMLEALPEETTQLLIDLCTKSPDPDAANNNAPLAIKQPTPTTATTTTSYLSYLALNRSTTVPTVVSSSETQTVAAPPSPSIKTLRAEGVSGRRDGWVDGATPPPSGSAFGVSTAVVGTNVDVGTALAHGAGAGAVSGLPPRSSTAPPEPPAGPPPVQRLSPSLYFSHFVDHMQQFVVFLETVAVRRWGQSVDDRDKSGEVGVWSEKGQGQGPQENENQGAEDTHHLDDIAQAQDRQDQIAVWNTLLELYLTLPAKDNESDRAVFDESKMREKALRVLRSREIPYDTTHALILCSTHAFTDGLVLLWEKLGMVEDVLRFWIDRHNSDPLSYPNASNKVVENLMLYGPQHPNLYPLVLRFLTSTEELLRKHEEDVRGVLEVVGEEGVMPPLAVVQVLGRNGVASVGLVREWLVRRIRGMRGEVQNDQELTHSYRLETESKLKLVKELSDPDQPRVFHVTRCSVCHAQLDLPSIHFMCGHSYHQRCLGDNETECPTCIQEQSVIREIRRNNERLADLHDVFLSEVRESGFEAVAEAFSRGMFGRGGSEGEGVPVVVG